MPETPSSPRPTGRRGDHAREALFQRIDVIVGSIRPAKDSAHSMAPRAQAATPAPTAVGATLVGAQVAQSAASPKEADPVFGRLLERWFALERDRVLGEHLHLDQVKAVAREYAPADQELRVVR